MSTGGEARFSIYQDIGEAVVTETMVLSVIFIARRTSGYWTGNRCQFRRRRAPASGYRLGFHKKLSVAQT